MRIPLTSRMVIGHDCSDYYCLDTWKWVLVLDCGSLATTGDDPLLVQYNIWLPVKSLDTIDVGHKSSQTLSSHPIVLWPEEIDLVTVDVEAKDVRPSWQTQRCAIACCYPLPSISLSLSRNTNKEQIAQHGNRTVIGHCEQCSIRPCQSNTDGAGGRVGTDDDGVLRIERKKERKSESEQGDNALSFLISFIRTTLTTSAVSLQTLTVVVGLCANGPAASYASS